MLSKYVYIFLLFCSFSTPTSGQGKPPFKIVHLGDSFSAGNGARASDGSENFHSVKKCFRSPTNWGSRFADSLKGVFSVTYINRACSGGVLKDFTEAREISGDCSTIDYPDEEFTSEIDGKCKRLLQPQIGAVDKSTDLVVLTAGGNDAKFSKIVTFCFVAVIRSGEKCKEAVEFAGDVLDGFSEKLETMLSLIRSKMKPEGRIIVVSYPYLTLDTDYVINGYDAASAIRKLGLKGDEVQKSAVNSANSKAGENYATFFDRTKEIFAGHEPDPSVLRKNPERWVIEFEGITPAEWYHPNQIGHNNWGNQLSSLSLSKPKITPGAPVDLVFVIDTTGSMGDDIESVKVSMNQLVNTLAGGTSSFRVAIVTYRDFPARSGTPLDYPSKIDLGFTNDLGKITTGINSLVLGDGGDFPETVLSGMIAAVNMPWRELGFLKSPL